MEMDLITKLQIFIHLGFPPQILSSVLLSIHSTYLGL